MSMTENDVIKHLCKWLENEGWIIKTVSYDRKHGDDIRAINGKKLLLVEEKGAKGNPKNHSVVRDKFDAGQIKNHLGKAIVKVLEMKAKEPDAVVAIAHPSTTAILKIVKPIAEQLIQNGILFLFVSDNGNVEWFRNTP